MSKKTFTSLRIDPSEHGPRQWAEVVIICAKNIEFDILREVLVDENVVIDDSLTPKHFIVTLGSTTRSYRILVVQLPTPGAGNVISGIIASKVAVAYSPWLVISFGIAGTLSSDVKANDVVYASEVGYADLRKDSGKDHLSWKNVPKEDTDSKLLSILNAYTLSQTAKRRPFQTHGVLLLSSEAVVKSTDAALQVFASSAMADAEAVEMEAFGVYRACQRSILEGDECPLALAIKGITDASDQTKDDRYHRSATMNAANVIRDLITEGMLDELANRYMFRSFPKLRVKPRRTYDTVNPDVQQFIEIVTPLMDFNKVSLRELRVSLVRAHLMSDRPPVFYHFRTTGPGLHWVEFSFLKVFRRLSEAGYPVFCLVTDEITDMPHNRLESPESLQYSKNKIEQLVDMLVPHKLNNPPVIWFSEVREYARNIENFASMSGYDRRATDELLHQPSFGGIQSPINFQLDLWFKWIAWLCRFDRTAIIFCNPNNVTSYDLLRVFGTFHPLLLPTRVFTLQGKLGKTEEPGARLYLDPPQHPTIREWLDEENDPETLREFMTVLKGEKLGAQQLSDDVNQLREVLQETFQTINRQWFGAS